jgi:hypothetical protein
MCRVDFDSLDFFNESLYEGICRPRSYRGSQDRENVVSFRFQELATLLESFFSFAGVRIPGQPPNFFLDSSIWKLFPLASLITGGARLMLSLLDHCVSQLPGTYVMEDTDSMAIVATERGGLVPCPGGPFEMPDGHAAVRALSWNEVDEIAARFAKLSPYADKSRSILKIERDNYDPKTRKQRQVYCLAIASKRYALFLRDESGNPVLLQKGINNHEDRWSEHGLGHLRNPMNPDGEGRDWIPQAWIRIRRT